MHTRSPIKSWGEGLKPTFLQDLRGDATAPRAAAAKLPTSQLPPAAGAAPSGRAGRPVSGPNTAAPAVADTVTPAVADTGAPAAKASELVVPKTANANQPDAPPEGGASEEGKCGARTQRGGLCGRPWRSCPSTAHALFRHAAGQPTRALAPCPRHPQLLLESCKTCARQLELESS